MLKLPVAQGITICRRKKSFSDKSAWKIKILIFERDKNYENVLIINNYW